MNIGVIILLVLIFIYLVLWVGTGGIGRMRFKWLFAGSLLVIIAGLVFWNWNIVIFGLLGGAVWAMLANSGGFGGGSGNCGGDQGGGESGGCGGGGCGGGGE